MLIAIAVIFGVLIGLIMGVLGGGGSILTVPILVYVLALTPQEATTASLIIVGVAAAISTVGHARRGRVRWEGGLAFGAIGVIGSLAGSRLNSIIDAQVLLIGFAAVMFVAAGAMFRRVSAADDISPSVARTKTAAAVRVVVAALVVGLLTGLFGVGGGFVIVPALLLALRYPMPTAVGTSLFIATINSAVAYAERFRYGIAVPWEIVLPFVLAAVVGATAGTALASRTNSKKLTRAFAILLVVVGSYVLARAVTALL